MVALAPVATVNHIKGGFRYLSKFSGAIKVLYLTGSNIFLY